MTLMNWGFGKIVIISMLLFLTGFLVGLWCYKQNYILMDLGIRNVFESEHILRAKPLGTEGSLTRWRTGFTSQHL